MMHAILVMLKDNYLFVVTNVNVISLYVLNAHANMKPKWKPGQLITICGEVYRVKRNCDTCMPVCKNCTFDNRSDCYLRLYEPKYRNCAYLIPDDCYFERVLP